MNLEHVEFNVYVIRTFFLVLFTYYTYLKITNSKIIGKKNHIIVNLFIITIAISVTIITLNINDVTGNVLLVLLLSIVELLTTKNNFGYAILTTIISLSFNYMLFFIVLILSYIINKVYVIKNDYINIALMIVIQWLILYRILKIKRLKHGISFLNKSSQDEYFDIIILNIALILVFSFIICSTINISMIKGIYVSFLIFAIIMVITIQKSIQLYYKKKLLVKELEDTKEELNNKKAEVVSLEKEILDFNKRSHSIAHKQKSLEYKLNQMMLKSETAEEIDIKDRLENISNEINVGTTNVELVKTRVMEIDDMLNFMQSECEKSNIEFNLQITGNIYTMINHYIPKEELEILIADHVKDAIIAINHSDNINKSILVKLGLVDECYGIYIYDSGIEFEKETLENLGKVPYTTHKDEGGTGMGFMNTFDTLRKYNASLIINELGMPSKDNYTKVIMIKFDNKNEFKIISYKDSVNSEK